MDIDLEDALELVNQNHHLCLKMKIWRSISKNRGVFL
jgi:hypothetical protein